MARLLGVLVIGALCAAGPSCAQELEKSRTFGRVVGMLVYCDCVAGNDFDIIRRVERILSLSKGKQFADEATRQANAVLDSPFNVPPCAQVCESFEARKALSNLLQYESTLTRPRGQPATKPAERRAPAVATVAAESRSADGVWRGVIRTEREAGNAVCKPRMTLGFRVQNNQPVGTGVKGSVKGSQIEVRFTAGTRPVRLRGKITGNTAQGKWSAGGVCSGSWTATRSGNRSVARQETASRAAPRKKAFSPATRQKPRRSPQTRATPGKMTSSGTGFYISHDGHILTSDHVVRGCRTVKIKDARNNVMEVTAVAQDSANDLALLRSGKPARAVANFRRGVEGQPGEAIAVVGHPLLGVLASTANITTGIVSADAGPGDLPTLLQVTAPVQPGNSGGPLVDQAGNVIGVMVSRVEKKQLAGGRPIQNVNFAIKGGVAQEFLGKRRVAFVGNASRSKLEATEIYKRIRPTVVAVGCWK